MKKIIFISLAITFLSACEDKEEQAKIQNQKNMSEVFVSIKDDNPIDGPEELDLENLLKRKKINQEKIAEK